ncbi:hypothetical protein DSO57_1000185 [Entomophthora muscae]|uniref:Uncharacterized protein n=1 Tax=Entomophthora muscae TaxID=34485 RepID=A0ACC2U7H8_9FUNG|nr:hypothetical protein DSO57_1000185 [Entomophthora muscae]
MVADLLAQIVFHMNMGNQSCKDKRFPPRATAIYQPIKAMTNEEYNQLYMAAITHNPPASIPAIPTPHLSAPPTHPLTQPVRDSVLGSRPVVSRGDLGQVFCGQCPPQEGS